MAHAGLRDILEAMADQIRTAIVDVDLDVQVEHRYVLNPSPLTIDMYLGDVARDRDSAAFDDVSGGYLITVRARINTPDFDAAYDVLLRTMDDTDDLSIAEAVLEDPTLNGYANSVDVRDFTGLRVFEHPSGEGGHLGFQFTAMVIPANS